MKEEMKEKKPELTAEEIKEIEKIIKIYNAIAKEIEKEAGEEIKKINTSKLEKKLEKMKNWKACK